MDLFLYILKRKAKFSWMLENLQISSKMWRSESTLSTNSKSAWDWCILLMEGANTIQIQNIHIQMQIQKKWKYEYKYKCIEQSCDAVKVLSSRSASDWCIAVHCLEGEGETNFKVIVIVETTNILLLTITFTSCTTSLIIWIISVIFSKTSEWK